MAIHIYRLDTGTLYSSVPASIALADAQAQGLVASNDVLAANGLAAVVADPIDTSHAWDATQKTVVSVMPRLMPARMSAAAWTMRFTPEEYAALKSSSDQKVQLLMYALARVGGTIDLNDPTVQDGLNYLVSVNILTSDRLTALLAKP